MCFHYPVNSNGPKKSNEGVKDHINVIVAKAEAIKNRNEFDICIPFKIIPVWISAGKKICEWVNAYTGKNSGEIRLRVSKQQLCLHETVKVMRPCIIHPCHTSLVYTQPAINDTRDHLYNKQPREPVFWNTASYKKLCLCYDPGKKQQVYCKQ